MYDLGSRLKAMRIRHGLTQRELAEKVNKSVSAISSYETNAQLPPLDVLESIALTLHVSLDYLVGMDRSNSLSTEKLTDNQIELVELLFQEFRTAKDGVNELTEVQVKIIQKLISEFIKKQRGG